MFLEKLIHWSQKTPKKNALICNGRNFSYLDFVKLITATRATFEAHNLQPNDTIIILTDDMLKAWMAIFAARALGMNTTPLPNGGLIELLNLKNIVAIITTRSNSKITRPNHSA